MFYSITLIEYIQFYVKSQWIELIFLHEFLINVELNLTSIYVDIELCLLKFKNQDRFLVWSLDCMYIHD